MSSPTPINDSFALPFGVGRDATKCYGFSLTAEQIKSIVDLAMSAPDFLKTAADFWANLLSGGKTADEFLKSFLESVKISACPTFQVTGSCKAYDSIKIEWYDPEVSQSSVPGISIDAKPRALDPVDGKCTCWAGESTPSGKCRCRVFIIKWWVGLSIKGIVRSFLAQIDHITVCSPCCCQNDAGESREEPLPHGKREDGTYKSPAIAGEKNKAPSGSSKSPEGSGAK